MYLTQLLKSTKIRFNFYTSVASHHNRHGLQRLGKNFRVRNIMQFSEFLPHDAADLIESLKHHLKFAADDSFLIFLFL